MNSRTRGGLLVFESERLASLGSVDHFVTTRHGGVSSGRYQSLNLGFTSGDDPELVRANRTRLAQSLGRTLSTMTFANQVHSAKVSVVHASDAGRGSAELSTAVSHCDAMITNSPGVVLVVLAADCVPILLADGHRKVVAAIHAGRRGTVGKIVARTVEAMCQTFGSAPSDIAALLAPSICAHHYSVEGQAELECIEALHATSLSRDPGSGRLRVDLWNENALELQAAGLNLSRIERANLCTHERPDWFFSERREGPPTGRFAAGIVIRDQDSPGS